MPLKLMYITNNPQIALIAQAAGVDRIFVDLETLGKAERQINRDAVKSKHKIEDIKIIKPLLTTSKMLVRVNPINPTSKEEIDAVIDNGADVIMLPMFKTCTEVEAFLDYVNGRTRVCLLLETAEAESNIDNILQISGIDEIHIGLNDLHLSHNMTFMFELLADGTVEKLGNKIHDRGIPYGFGGIASLGTGILSADNILAEHYRLGSSQVILSRSFCNAEKIKDINTIKKIFTANVAALRNFEEELSHKPSAYFIENKLMVKQKVSSIVSHMLATK
jgi:2-keto-3-deoxy-L-rhamnonate aldolase RhmA